MAGKLEPAFILNNDDPSDRLTCLFNPSEYTFTKTNQWETKPLTGKNLPSPHFKGGDIMSMKFQLFFDTYVGEESAMKDVREYTNKLLKLMAINPNTKKVDPHAKKGRPPIVTFHWGNYWSFKGVIKSCSLKFTLFTAQGKPVRATADIELQQAEEEGMQPKQNPTSGGEQVRASYLVQPGDTLDLIAYREYGDATKWRPLALANGLENPRALRAGQRLLVPET